MEGEFVNGAWYPMEKVEIPEKPEYIEMLQDIDERIRVIETYLSTMDYREEEQSIIPVIVASALMALFVSVMIAGIRLTLALGSPQL